MYKMNKIYHIFRWTES